MQCDELHSWGCNARTPGVTEKRRKGEKEKRRKDYAMSQICLLRCPLGCISINCVHRTFERYDEMGYRLDSFAARCESVQAHGVSGVSGVSESHGQGSWRTRMRNGRMSEKAGL